MTKRHLTGTGLDWRTRNGEELCVRCGYVITAEGLTPFGPGLEIVIDEGQGYRGASPAIAEELTTVPPCVVAS